MKSKLFIAVTIIFLYCVDFNNANAETVTDFIEQTAINTTAYTTKAVYSSDLDNDGDLDILSASNGDTLAWYKNNRDGTFLEQSSITTSLDGVSSIYAADLDNDGDMDVLSSSFLDDTLAWYMNNGDGTFTIQTAISTNADGASFIYAADMDNDGDMDVLSASSLDNTLAWYRNNGAGIFSQKIVISSTFSGVEIVYALDINNDGNMDVLAASSLSNKISWFNNNKDGTFTEETSISTTANGVNSISFADINNDGNIDVLSANTSDNSIMWYENNGDNTFAEQSAISTNSISVFVVDTADLDNDGDLDLISGNEDGTISWYENNRNKDFKDPIVISTKVEGVSTIISGDLDNDGDLDIIVSGIEYDNITWFKNDLSLSAPTVTFELDGGAAIEDYSFRDKSGFVEQTALSTTAEGASSVYAVDLDNDGDIDVLSASSSDDTISWFKNDGSGNFIEQAVITSSANGVYAVISADIDNDGNMDVISSNLDSSTISWYKNNDNGTFTEQSPISITSDGVTGIHASDLDNDGDMDIIAACYSSDSVEWFENNGDGTFSSKIIISDALYNITSVYASDLDNDGDSDILQAAVLSNTLTWYKNNDDKTFADSAIIQSSIHTGSVIKAADLDSDGYQDIILSSWSLGTITWYHNNGDGTFTEEIPVSNASPFVTDIHTVDIDNDGDIDIVSANSHDNVDAVIYYLNNGDGTFSGYFIIANDVFGASSVFAADLDNDGDMDIISSSRDDNTITWYKNNLSAYQLIPLYGPFKEGYVFEAWYTDSEFTNLYNFETIVENNFTLYAKYAKTHSKIEFLDYDGSIILSNYYEVGEDLSLINIPMDPYREGYYFNGWIGSIPENMGSEDITMTASYTIEQFYLEFVDYDGTVLQTQTFNYNDDLTGIIPPEDPTRTGYIFDSWDGSIPSVMGTENITLRAVYISYNHQVNYIDYDGTILQTETYLIGSDLTSVSPPNPPLREGYTFYSWIGEVPDTMGDSDVIITASYTVNSYQVSFYMDEAITTEFVDYLGTIQSIPDPLDSKEGYAFVGWEVNGILLDPSTYVQGLQDTIFTAVYRDETSPIVQGVIHEQTYTDSELTITFNEGSATLNNKEFVSGTKVSEIGEYKLIVTDEFGNTTIVNFVIEGETNSVFLIGAAVVGFVIIVFILKKVIKKT